MSGLSDPGTATRIGLATNGIPDYIIKLVTGALEEAVKNKREIIIREDFRSSVTTLFEDSCTDDLNPFSPKNDDLRVLDQAGEPFEGWLEDGYE
jgi:hypothetical protein